MSRQFRFIQFVHWNDHVLNNVFDFSNQLLLWLNGLHYAIKKFVKVNSCCNIKTGKWFIPLAALSVTKMISYLSTQIYSFFKIVLQAFPWKCSNRDKIIINVKQLNWMLHKGHVTVTLFHFCAIGMRNVHSLIFINLLYENCALLTFYFWNWSHLNQFWFPPKNRSAK